jgi:hypothetical protein
MGGKIMAALFLLLLVGLIMALTAPPRRML